MIKKENEGLAIIGLVFAILSFFVLHILPMFGIIAIAFGKMSFGVDSMGYKVAPKFAYTAIILGLISIVYNFIVYLIYWFNY